MQTGALLVILHSFLNCLFLTCEEIAHWQSAADGYLSSGQVCLLCCSRMVEPVDLGKAIL